MDTIFTRLEEASRVGDVVSLKTLLAEDKSLLEKVTARTSVRDNPLHIAALSGHADFVAEIMSRKPELAKELNGQGLSPLHLATANDHLLVVKELLKAGCDLCLLREEKEGLLPFHAAVIKGRTLIAKELLEAGKKAMFELTYGGDTALHLGVKSNSFDTLEFLISRMQDLNAKDGNGNTILHLAVARKQLCVIKLLLSNSGVDVNSVNSKGQTPLDILFESQHECGDLFIGEMIRTTGGKTTYQPRTSQHFLLNSFSSHALLNEPERDIEKGNMEQTNIREDNNIILVVAILIATITFQAALNPPGGYFPDDAEHRSYGSHAANVAGQAVLGDHLHLFLILDIGGLFTSVIVILFYLEMISSGNKRMTPEKEWTIQWIVWALWGSAITTALAFITAISVIFKKEYNVKVSLAWYVLLTWLGLLGLTTRGAFRLIIFLLKKGEMYKPIHEFFSALLKGPFGCQRLNDVSAATYWLKKCACLKKIGYILLILLIVLTCISYVFDVITPLMSGLVLSNAYGD